MQLRELAHNICFIKNTLILAEMIKNDVLDPKEEYVSYDVEGWFTSIPVKETIGYTITEIYENKVIERMCKSKLVFRQLLEKLTQNCVFSVSNKLVKQVDGCLIGRAISVIILGIHMNRLENV